MRASVCSPHTRRSARPASLLLAMVFSVAHFLLNMLLITTVLQLKTQPAAGPAGLHRQLRLGRHHLRRQRVDRRAAVRGVQGHRHRRDGRCGADHHRAPGDAALPLPPARVRRQCAATAPRRRRARGRAGGTPPAASCAGSEQRFHSAFSHAAIGMALVDGRRPRAAGQPAPCAPCSAPARAASSARDFQDFVRPRGRAGAAAPVARRAGARRL